MIIECISLVPYCLWMPIDFLKWKNDILGLAHPLSSWWKYSLYLVFYFSLRHLNLKEHWNVKRSQVFYFKSRVHFQISWLSLSFFSEGCFVISSVSSFELYSWCFLFKTTCTYYQTWHSSWQPALGGFLDSPVFSLTPWCYMVASNKGFFEISESVSC